MRVKELMSTGICCVRPDTSVAEITRQMRKTDVGAIPVCNDKEELLGIVTDRDIVIRFLAAESAKRTADTSNMSDAATMFSVCAADIMSTNIISAPEDMNIHDAALLMSHHQIRRLPITAGGRLVGILTTADIARRPIMADEAGDILQAVSRPATS
ncbi:MAG: CBS domain-containing protein [Firmicutes bacterium]|nr:CBS domain-containing protein [Bacillota bacterium]